MDNLKQKIRYFMAGRYGLDDLGKITMDILVVMIFVSFFIRFKILRVVIWIGIFWWLFRILSKNKGARSAENEKYLRWRHKRISQARSNEKIFQCPKCGQKVRVPKGKGKIAIRCPKCNHQFVKRT